MPTFFWLDSRNAPCNDEAEGAGGQNGGPPVYVRCILHDLRSILQYHIPDVMVPEFLVATVRIHQVFRPLMDDAGHGTDEGVGDHIGEHHEKTESTNGEVVEHENIKDAEKPTEIPSESVVEVQAADIKDQESNNNKDDTTKDHETTSTTAMTLPSSTESNSNVRIIHFSKASVQTLMDDPTYPHDIIAFGTAPPKADKHSSTTSTVDNPCTNQYSYVSADTEQPTEGRTASTISFRDLNLTDFSHLMRFLGRGSKREVQGGGGGKGAKGKGEKKRLTQWEIMMVWDRIDVIERQVRAEGKKQAVKTVGKKF